MKKRAFIFIIAAGIFWGTSGIFVNLLSPYGFNSIHLSAIRGAVAFVCISVYALLRKRSLFKVRLTELLLFAVIGLSLFVTGSAYFASMQKTSIATAVVLMYTAPVIVMVFSVLFLGEKLTKLKTVSVACMLVGCGLVSGIIGGLKFHPLGILLGFLSGISYAAYNIVTKVTVSKGSKPMSASLYSFLVMALIAVPIADPVEIVTLCAQKSAFLIPMALGTGICTFVVPYVLYTLALKDLDAGSASALSIVEPMAATVFGMIFFKEMLTVPSAIGIILILFSVVALSCAEGKDKNETHKD